MLCPACGYDHGDTADSGFGYTSHAEQSATLLACHCGWVRPRSSPPGGAESGGSSAAGQDPEPAHVGPETNTSSPRGTRG